MIRIVALSASALILSSCATRSAPPPPIEQPAAEAQDPRVCAPLEAEPPVAGDIVQPVTAEEVEGTRAFLNGEAEARAWGRRGWGRAAVAREACPV